MLKKHSMSWMTLSSDYPFEAHLVCTIVQSRAEAQPVFRHYWNYDTRSGF
jgi:hypothetical protein